MVVQYLDDIPVVRKQKQEVHNVTHDVTSALSKAGFLIGAKSILTPVAEVTWMGKTVNAQVGRIQPRPAAFLMVASLPAASLLAACTTGPVE